MVDLRYTQAFKECMISTICGLCEGGKADINKVNYYFKWIYFPRFPLQRNPLNAYLRYLNKNQMYEICLAYYRILIKLRLMDLCLFREILLAALSLERFEETRKVLVLMKVMCKSKEDKVLFETLCEDYIKKKTSITNTEVRNIEDELRGIVVESCGDIFEKEYNEYVREWQKEPPSINLN